MRRRDFLTGILPAIVATKVATANTCDTVQEDEFFTGKISLPGEPTKWYKDGKLHRFNGTKVWYRDGKLHRNDGPAVIWADGSEWWYKNGKLHRQDGPAIIYSTGEKKWWREGRFISSSD